MTYCIVVSSWLRSQEIPASAAVATDISERMLLPDIQEAKVVEVVQEPWLHFGARSWKRATPKLQV
jgi:hypothetical protein